MRNLFKIGVTLVLTALAYAQGGNFQGQIRYDNNTAAMDVRVELWTDGGTYRTTTSTDRMGKFQVQAPCGVIQYKIEHPGYRPVYGRVDISTMCRALEDVTLRPLPGTTPPTAKAEAPIDARIAA